MTVILSFLNKAASAITIKHDTGTLQNNQNKPLKKFGKLAVKLSVAKTPLWKKMKVQTW